MYSSGVLMKCQFKQLHPIWDGRLVRMKMGKEIERKRERKEEMITEKIYGGLRPTNLTDADNRGTLIHGRLKRETTAGLNLFIQTQL